MNQTVEIYIDELVLHGFSPYERYNISEAVQNELSRLFSEQGIPPAFLQGGSIPVINSAAFQLPKVSKGVQVGGQIAGSVYESFNGIAGKVNK